MRIFDKFKKSKEKPAGIVNEDIFAEFFSKPMLPSADENQLLADKYALQLNELKSRFQTYKKNTEAILNSVSGMIVKTAITKGVVANVTPFNEERLGLKQNGKSRNQTNR